MSSDSDQAPHKATKDLKIYFAAALFCTRECIFNIELANKLEADGFQCKVPQRDGFEFDNVLQGWLERTFKS